VGGNGSTSELDGAQDSTFCQPDHDNVNSEIDDVLSPTMPKRRGSKPNPAARQIEQLNRDIARLRRKLEHAELIIDAQKNYARFWDCRPRDDRTPEER
jgi:hypothetical protein